MSKRHEKRLARRVDETPAPSDELAGPTLVLGSERVVAPGTGFQLASRPVDICFVFDTTGSMSDKIDGLVRCMVELVQELARLDLDWRVTTVPFGDLTIPGDRVVGSQPFVSTQAAAEAQLRSMPGFSGGGNRGESSIEAMQAALAKRFRPEVVKVFVLLTDEPALQSRQAVPEMVGRALREAEAICFVASPDLPYYRRWAEENGGTWLLIGPSMDTRAVLSLLRSLVRQVASVAHQVHEVGGGSVRRYLEITSGSEISPK